MDILSFFFYIDHWCIDQIYVLTHKSNLSQTRKILLKNHRHRRHGENFPRHQYKCKQTTKKKYISNELNWQNPKIGAEIYKFIHLFIPYGEGRSHYICGPHKYNEHFLDEEKHVICIDAECPTSRHHLNFPIKCLYMPEMAMFFLYFFVI